MKEPTHAALLALRAALDDAKHAMADVRSWLDLPDQADAWHRLNREIAAAEAALAAHEDADAPAPIKSERRAP